jgi:hypothetical protein
MYTLSPATVKLSITLPYSVNRAPNPEAPYFLLAA